MVTVTRATETSLISTARIPNLTEKVKGMKLKNKKAICLEETVRIGHAHIGN